MFGASLLNVFITKFSVVVKIQVAGIFTKVEEAKAFVERRLLHRVVGIELLGQENNGNFAARAHHPAGDIASELVKLGFAKVNIS